MLQAEKFRQFIFFQFRADDAEPAGIVRMPRAHLVFLRYIVELQPRAVLAVDNAFGPEDCAVLAGIQGRKDPFQIPVGEGLGRFPAPGGEHLVGMVVMVFAAAMAVIVVMLVMVRMVVIVIMMVFMFVVVIMVIVAAAAVFSVVVMMLMRFVDMFLM